MSFVVHPDLSIKESQQVKEAAINSTVFYNYLKENSDIVHCFDEYKLKILCQRNL